MRTDPKPLLYHADPVLRDGRIVSYIGSGSYGNHLGAAMGMGHVRAEAYRMCCS